MRKPIFLNMFFLLIILILFLYTSACKDSYSSSYDENENAYVNLQLPIYPGGYNVKENFYDNLSLKVVEYDLDMFYPGQAIINYYDKAMKTMAFEPFVEDYYKARDREWTTYIDGTKKGEPHVAVNKMSWVDNDKTKRATLVLKYFWHKKEGDKIILSDNKNLKVQFRIQPFYKEPSQP